MSHDRCPAILTQCLPVSVRECGKRTICVVKLGMEHGLALPMNSCLVHRIKEIEGPYAFSENRA